jgi:hypothetical protein
MTAAFFLLFSWFMVTAKTRRRVVAVALTGTVAATLIAPPRVQAQGSLWVAIQAVLNVIDGIIQTALNSINSVRSAVSAFYQGVVWPVQLINQAQAQVSQMITQYRNLMEGIFTINLSSATLPTPQALEAVMRNQQINDFGTLGTDYTNNYQAVPGTTAASTDDRNLTDMDDALAMDNLKTLKATDDADNLTLSMADQIENGAGGAAPGSAPFLTATAVAASIQSQALTQKMMAAELRQEAASLAHANALRKRQATFTGQLGTEIQNLLNHN